jgi:hypothetical protein
MSVHFAPDLRLMHVPWNNRGTALDEIVDSTLGLYVHLAALDPGRNKVSPIRELRANDCSWALSAL